MTRFFTLAAITVLLSSCFSTQVNYLGNSYQPTRHVDVYVDAGAIKKPYFVMGKGFVDPTVYGRSAVERMQENVIEKAREKGADAVLFRDVYVVNDGTSISTTAQTDSVGKSLVTSSKTAVGPVISSHREILFLKYETSTQQ